MSNKLLHSKLSKKRILSHLPSKTDGHDGDIQIVSIKSKGTFLCVKNNGDWKISDKFSDRNRFDTHEFDKIKAPKIYGRSGLNISLQNESIATNTYALKSATSSYTANQPVLKIGSGSTTGVLSSLGNQDLLLKTGNSTTSNILIKDGANGSIATAMNGTGKFDIAWNSNDSDSGELGLLNIGQGNSFLNLQVAHGAADPFVRYTFLADSPSNNKQWVTGMDGTDNSFKINYFVSATLATPSNGTSKLTIDTSGNTTTSGTATAGGFTTTGTITMPELTDDAAIGITKIQDSGTSFTDNDTSIMTAAAISNKIEAYSYSTTTGTVTSVGTTGTVNGVTLTGTVTSSGSLALGGTLAINNGDWSGTDLSVANGGTGASTLTDNNILTGTGTSAITAESNLTFDGTDLAIAATGKIYLDGGGDTYIHESSADVFQLFVGGQQILNVSENGSDGNTADFKTTSVGFTRSTHVDAADVTVDFRAGNKAHLDMTGGSISGTLTLQFPAVSGNFVLVVQQDGSTRTIAAYATKDAAGNAGDNDGGTGGAIRWAGGSVPDLTDGGSKRDVLSFYWDATEEVCYGVASLNF